MQSRFLVIGAVLVALGFILMMSGDFSNPLTRVIIGASVMIAGVLISRRD